MVKLPSVEFLTLLAIWVAASKMMFRLFGKDDVSRQVIFGRSWAIAGVAKAAAAAPMPAVVALCRKRLRSMKYPPEMSEKSRSSRLGLKALLPAPTRGIDSVCLAAKGKPRAGPGF